MMWQEPASDIARAGLAIQGFHVGYGVRCSLMAHIYSFACPAFGQPASVCGEEEAVRGQRGFIRLHIFSLSMTPFIYWIPRGRSLWLRPSDCPLHKW
jgi:hypothetical protein